MQTVKVKDVLASKHSFDPIHQVQAKNEAKKTVKSGERKQFC